MIYYRCESEATEANEYESEMDCIKDCLKHKASMTVCESIDGKARKVTSVAYEEIVSGSF